MAELPRPVVLCIVDGFGQRAAAVGNAIQLAQTPELDALYARHPSTEIAASGAAVGLADAAPGHGEVGLLTLGAGRQVARTRQRIDASIAARKLGAVPMLAQTFRIATDRRCRLHLLGLISDAGIHGSMDHLHALLQLADFHEVQVVVHAILDGRDMAPRSALPLLERLELLMEDGGSIGTVMGRSFVLDAGEDWDRLYRAFHAIVRDPVLGPAAPHADSVFDALSIEYGQGRDDAQIVPTRIGGYQGLVGDFLCDFASAQPVWEWTGEEVGLAFNDRGDGLRALSSMLTRRDLPADVASDLLMDRDKPVLAFDEHCFCTLTDYGPSLKLPVAFGREPLSETCGEVVAAAGLTQLRCGETLKRAHPTELFSGGRTEPFDGEQRQLASSSVALDPEDLQHRPRTAEGGRGAVEAVRGGSFDFVVVHFAGPDVVARTGDLEATIAAVEEVDQQLGELARAVHERGGALLLTSDHGNSERMGESAEARPGAVTTSPVPLLYVNDRDREARLRPGGGLPDVAPTVLQLLGLTRPSAMTGRSLLESSSTVP